MVVIGGICVFLSVSVALANRAVVSSARGSIFLEAASVPKHRVALVLGTAPTVAGGRRNVYFEARLNAAAKLYKAGRVEKILASGDNSTEFYDEPTAMKEGLVARGIPSEDVALDFAGFRTLDSIVRAKQVFGLSDLVIITDDFHLPRALYIAKHLGMDAVGFQTKSMPVSVSPKTWVREAGSRTLMFVDLIVGRQPRFLGPKESI
jgi:SanA protein